jgi:hypothetical protein
VRLSKPVIALSSLALSAAALTSLPGSPANASPGSSEYAQWTLKDESGTVRVANVGGEGDFITVGADASLESGSDTWLSAQTPFGLEFGSSRGTKYLSTALAAGSPSAIVTYTFTDSGRVGTWAFALGDIDTESVTVRATDPQGNDINVDFWFQGVFNYCGANGTRPSTCSGSPGTNVPQWDAATATLVGNGTDTSGATGWFRPTQAVRTLTIEMTGLAGFPAYQTWMAADDDESPPQFLVTVAARTCPTYQDVMANQARNNVMESLEDLGADSIYPGGGTTPVQPSVETDPATGQSACQPLSGWTFGFGDGFAGADTGPYGSLSTVANLNGSATTLPTTELLDSLGNPTGQTLDGAATIALDDTQTFIAQGGGWLTAQGGLPGTPLNGISNIAFGILRCAIDNVNGDNVEYVTFPAGTKHVFCYAYYVDTTPAATPPCPLDVSAAKSVPANGTTLLIRSVATGDGCGITDIEVTCPTARATPRGDYGCTVRRESNDRVYVTTYGKKNLTVTAKIVATGPDHTKTTWTRTWSVT